MTKRPPMDVKSITESHLEHLDDDDLGMLVQRIEVQTQQLNRAMRLVADAMAARRNAE